MTRIEDRLVGYVGSLDAESTPITPDEVLTSRTQTGRKRGRALLATGVAIIVLVAGVIVLESDDDTQVVTGPADGPAQEPPPEALVPLSDDFSLWLSAAEVPPGDLDIVAVLLNHTGVDATFGVVSNVERWDGETWVPHRRLAMCLDHWHCTSEMHDLDDSEFAVQDIGLSAEPGSPGPPERFSTAGLTEGWYRISQAANEGQVASGVLRVVEGAEPPVPLWPTDAPAISVNPCILAPDGGPISLSPLVPPTNGSQSSEDIEQAVEGLADVARIELWDGSGWAVAGEVSLAVDESAGLFAHSVELPPLEVGAYRLVRTGADEPHVGNFWIVDNQGLDGQEEDVPALSLRSFLPANRASEVELLRLEDGYSLHAALGSELCVVLRHRDGSGATCGEARYLTNTLLGASSHIGDRPGYFVFGVVGPVSRYDSRSTDRLAGTSGR